MIFHWAPDPVAFSIEAIHLHVYWYGILFAAGFILGYFIVRGMCRRKGYPLEKLDALLFFLFLGTLVGARLAHVIFYQPGYYLEHPLEIIQIWRGGLASHGGTVGAFLGFFYFCWKNREFSPLWLLDHIASAVALVACFIRLGNFMNSEIVGVPTGGDFGIVFDRLGSEPLHPVQLYESFSYLSVGIVVHLLYRLGMGTRPGFLFGVFFSWTFLSRMLLEVFKSSQAEYEQSLNNWISQYVSLPFTVSVGMLLSIPFVMAGLGFMIYGLTHRDDDFEKPLPAAAGDGAWAGECLKDAPSGSEDGAAGADGAELTRNDELNGGAGTREGGDQRQG